MKIVAISDLHGKFPDVPSCDLLLICGDICPATNHTCDFQEGWLDSVFRSWLKHVDAKKKIFIAGNHDFIFQQRPDRVSRLLRNFPATYLEDSETEWEGLRIYGTPWQPYFYDWAFNLYEEDLKKKWEKIPSGTDILVVHGPPNGYGDLCPRIIKSHNEEEWPEGEHVGSPSLLEKVKEVKPKLVVFGHIHRGYGKWSLDETTLANVSVVDERYELVRGGTVFKLDSGKIVGYTSSI